MILTIVDYILLVVLNALCIVAAVNDAKTRKIPNWIPLSLFVVWFVSIFVKWGLAAYNLIDFSVMDVFGQCAIQVIFACVIFCILCLCINIVNNRNKKLGRPQTIVFGMGDIKLLVMLCLYLNIYASLICILISCIAFIIYIFIIRIRTKKKIVTAPFAPFILVGVMISTGVMMLL